MLKALSTEGFFCHLQMFSMYQMSPNDCYLSWMSSDFYLGWKPKLTVHIQKLWFLYDSKIQLEVKSWKTKENGISNLRENGRHSLDEGNPYIKTNLHTGCFRKVAKKQGTKIASWAHIYMVFSIKQIHWQNVWHNHNLLCKKWVWITITQWNLK